MSNPLVSQFFTMGELINALNSMGVVLERPACTPAELHNTSASTAVISNACDAIEEHQWSILHTGASDLILAGPAGSIPIPDVVEALVRVRAEQTTTTENPECRARYSGSFSCANCNYFNLLRLHNSTPASDRWYCVVAGLEVGVFQGSTLAGAQTINVKGSSMKGYDTRAEAEAAFEMAKEAGAVKKITPVTQTAI